MSEACCNYCLAFIKVERNYNPKIHRRYCSKECFINDAAFEEFYSDEKIGLRNYEEYGINNDPEARRRR